MQLLNRPAVPKNKVYLICVFVLYLSFCLLLASVFLLLKGSYDVISSFSLSLECYKLFVHIRSVKLQRLKSQTKRDILYKS